MAIRHAWVVPDSATRTGSTRAISNPNERPALDTQLAGVLAIGASRTSWRGVMLRLDLAFLGAPGNTLYLGIDHALPLSLVPDSARSWRARATLPIPGDRALRWREVHFQAVLADAAANRSGLVTAAGMAVRIGDPAQRPPVRVVGSPYSTTVGAFVGDGGLVTELVGTFR